VAGFVFVSASGADRTAVQRLRSYLWSQGVRTRDDRVEACAAVIVVMSPASEDSPQVATQVGRARQLGLPLFPVLVAGRPFASLSALPYEDARVATTPPHELVGRLIPVILNARTLPPPEPSTAPVVAGSQNRPALVVAVVALVVVVVLSVTISLIVQAVESPGPPSPGGTTQATPRPQWTDTPQEHWA
jgi:hypothetical protein